MIWDGVEAPDGTALLEIARRALIDDVIPHLDGDVRFKALMVANALAIALRERASPIIHHDLDDGAALCAAIRAGAHDPGTPDHDRIEAMLGELAEARCRVSAPKAVGRISG